MKVLAVASYPVEAAASRYRILQFVPYLRDRGIDVEFSPFVSSKAFRTLYVRKRAPLTAMRLAAATARRVVELATLRKADVVFVQREAMLFGPPLFERLAAARRPLVLDLDDPTWLGSVYSVYGSLVAALRWRSKGDQLIRMADAVLCGNEAIAEYVRSRGGDARVLPTIVDPAIFRPCHDASRRTPVIGWIGTQATYHYLVPLFPVLERLRKKHDFAMKIVGSDRPAPAIEGVEVRNQQWELAREADDFCGIDIGLYPLVDEAYARGKSGFKAIQYMASGVPFVTSPVGVCASIGEPDRTHFLAATADEWYAALDRLLANAALRRDMGDRGRQHVLERYAVEDHAATLAAVLTGASISRARVAPRRIPSL